jgi:hypothetical protein
MDLVAVSRTRPVSNMAKIFVQDESEGQMLLVSFADIITDKALKKRLDVFLVTRQRIASPSLSRSHVTMPNRIMYLPRDYPVK